MSVPSFENADSRELLDELRRLERDAVIRSQGYWFALVVFGVITMLSTRIDADWIGLYWTVAAPLGAVAVFVFYQWRDVPVVRSSLWYLALPLFVIVGTSVVDEVATGQAGYVAAYTIVGLGFLGYAWLERSFVLGCVALATPAIAGLMALIDRAEPPALPSTIGFLWFLVGLIVGVSRA